MSKRKSSQQDFDNPLADVLKFDAADLEDNRQGFISHKQKKHLYWLSFLGENLYTTTFCTGYILLFSLLAIESSVTQQNPYIGYIFIFMVLVGILALIFFTRIIRRKFISDLKKGDVEEVRGLMTTEFEVAGGGYYYLHIGTEKFAVTPWMYKHFDNGTHYAIYYAPESRIFLSAEKLMPKELADEQA